MSFARVSRFLILGLIEGVIFTLICCTLGTTLVLWTAGERGSPTGQAHESCLADAAAAVPDPH